MKSGIILAAIICLFIIAIGLNRASTYVIKNACSKFKNEGYCAPEVPPVAVSEESTMSNSLIKFRPDCPVGTGYGQRRKIKYRFED